MFLGPHLLCMADFQPSPLWMLHAQDHLHQAVNEYMDAQRIITLALLKLLSFKQLKSAILWRNGGLAN